MSGNILIVDDEHNILNLIDKFLTKQGYSCDISDTVEKGFELIKKNDYHIILTDKNMPSKDGSNDEGGLEILEYALKHDPSVEVMIMTGHATIESAVTALQLGAIDYIFKPFKLDDLIEKIDFIRKCQNFIDSENITNFYKSFNKSLSKLLDDEYGIDFNQQNQLQKFFNDKLDFIFKTIKQLERTVISQRDSMALLASQAGKILDRTSETDPNRELLEKLYEEASHRV